MSDARKSDEVQVVVSGGEGRARSKHHFSPGHPEYHEGAPEWLISFADMVMLMMGFFVILFALNFAPKHVNASTGAPVEDGEQPAPTPDMIDFAIAVRKAFNNEVDLASTDPKDRPLIDRILSRQAGAGEARDDGIEGREMEVRTVRPAPRFGTGVSIAFGERSSDLLPEDERVLTQLARSLRGLQSVVEVRGHASAAESFRTPEEAMKLAFDRAFAVAGVLVREGVSWRRLRLASEGDHDRVAAFPRDPADDRRNARAEVLVLDEIASDSVPRRSNTASDGEESGNDEVPPTPLP
ncbi:MAG: hypothetical protein FJ253_09335 [Phycisphaerae bacterium]|nr:hypothetical protein [Phycisphaerae bacterium]